MSTVDAVVARSPQAAGSLLERKMQRSSPGKWGLILFATVLVAGFGYAGVQLGEDLSEVGHISSDWPYVLLGVALLGALGFEFVNGFHDTANAVATVIYTHSLEPHIAVVWSGIWNFVGVLTSSGAVAFAIVSLLPVELILQVGKGGGLRDGVCAADLRDPVESEHMVPRASGIEFAHADWIDHWRGRCESTDVCADGNERSGLGAGGQGVSGAADFSGGGIRVCRPAAAVAESDGAGQAAVRGACRRGSAAVLDSRVADFDVHGRELLSRVERWAEGHGPDHADPDWHGADGVCAEPRGGLQPGSGFRGSVRAGGAM